MALLQKQLLIKPPDWIVIEDGPDNVLRTAKNFPMNTKQRDTFL